MLQLWRLRGYRGCPDEFGRGETHSSAGGGGAIGFAVSTSGAIPRGGGTEEAPTTCRGAGAKVVPTTCEGISTVENPTTCGDGGAIETPPTCKALSPGFRVLMRVISSLSLSSCILLSGRGFETTFFSAPSHDSLSPVKCYYAMI